eukprot:6178405-Pleurochrysis_carterae.AAC.1
MELAVEGNGVQLVLVEVQNVLEVALELKEFGPALVSELLGDSVLGVVGHDDVDVSVDAARWSCYGQSSGHRMPIALVLPYGRYPNGQKTQVQGTQEVLESLTKTMSQTCQLYRHSPSQPLVAHTGSATGSDYSLDAPVV